MTTMAPTKIHCPECGQLTEHHRGYLLEHDVAVQRGSITVGHMMCDGSNSKPNVALKRVSYDALCPNCGTYQFDEDNESFPGSLDTYGGIRVIECDSCGPGVTVRLTDNHVIVEDDDPVS